MEEKKWQKFRLFHSIPRKPLSSPAITSRSKDAYSRAPLIDPPWRSRGLIYRKPTSRISTTSMCHPRDRERESERKRDAIVPEQCRRRCCARRLHREQWSLYDAECRYLMTTRRIKFQAPTELALLTAAASKRIRIGEHLLYSPALTLANSVHARFPTRHPRWKRFRTNTWEWRL